MAPIVGKETIGKFFADAVAQIAVSTWRRWKSISGKFR